MLPNVLTTLVTVPHPPSGIPPTKLSSSLSNLQKFSQYLSTVVLEEKCKKFYLFLKSIFFLRLSLCGAGSTYHKYVLTTSTVSRALIRFHYPRCQLGVTPLGLTTAPATVQNLTREAKAVVMNQIPAHSCSG